jgi:secretion/DNA translocation related CpaE-like protein
MQAPVGSSVVLLSRDPRLIEDVRRLCAIAGAAVRVCPDPGDGGAWWRSAGVVCVDADLADAAVAAGLPRRDGVLVLAEHPGELAPWRAATLLGAEQVYAPGVDDQLLVDRVARAADGDRTPGRLVAVLPGSGGAGASTLAVVMAVRASATQPVTLVDLDAYGGGLDLPLGLEHVPGVRWPELSATRGVLRRDAFDHAVLRHGSLALVPAGRGAVEPLPAAAVGAVLDVARRGSPLVLVDLPPSPTAASELALQTADAVVLVVTAQVRAVAAAVGVVQQVLATGRRPTLVLRTERRDRLDARDVAAALGVEVAATVVTDHDVATAADRGELGKVEAGGRLGAVAGGLLRDVGAGLGD